MDKENDKLYPLNKHDLYRICANLIPANINRKDKVLIKYRECGKRYEQWSRLQDNEAWSQCYECATPKKKKSTHPN